MSIKLLFFILALFTLAPSAALSLCDSLSDPFSKARCLEADSQATEALFLMHPVVKGDPASYDKGRLYLRLLVRCDDKPGLKQYLPVFAKNFGGGTEAVIEAARAYAVADDWKGAVRLLEAAYGQNGRFPLLVEMTEIYIQFRRFEQAQSIIGILLQKDSTYARAYYWQGKLVFKKGVAQLLKERKSREETFRDALAYYHQAERLDSLCADYPLEIADCYDQLYRPDSAALAFRRAVRIQPGNFLLLYRFGKFQLQNKETDEALALLEQAYAVNAMSVDLLFTLEEAHRQKGDYFDYYLTGQERLADAMPDTLSIRYNLAVEYANRKLWADAETSFRKVLARNNRFENANRALAALYLADGRCADALPYLTAQTKLSSTDRDYYNLGTCCFREGDTMSGLAAYEKVLMKNPSDAVTAYFLGTYYFNLKDYAQCVKFMPEALNYKNPAGAQRMLGGSLFYLEKEPARARKLLRLCVGTAEEDEMVHYMLATLAERLNDRAGAAAEYEKCLRLYPESQNVPYYRDRLRKLK
ncbi:MAG: tetratricopeptide repeat protein [Fibrobacterota bacterium]